ncbi:MAG: hypothetical protein ACXQTG_04070 [Methanoculleaceae archaeon]
MNKDMIQTGLGLSALILVSVSGGLYTGLMDRTVGIAVIVIAFPVFVLCLGLWWRMGGGKRDVPFIGF